MALGLCCEWVETHPTKGMVNKLVSKHLQLGRFESGRYTSVHIKQTYVSNLQNLLDILPIIIKHNLRFFRLSSSLFPLFDKVPSNLYQNEEISGLLKQIGNFVLSNKVRIVTHPAQFVVLSSDDLETVENSIREMNFHGWLFDQIGLPRSPYYAINIHGGKGGRSLSLIKAIQRLDDAARSRMTLENDEFSYAVKDLEIISKATGVPIVFDSHHHSFNTGGMSIVDGLEMAISTWPSGVKPTTHLSNTPEEHRTAISVTKRRIHADYIEDIPVAQLDAHQKDRIDIEVEAKAKNLALFAMANKFGMRVS